MWGDFLVRTAPANILLGDGDTLTFGEHQLDVVHLPGHSAGSVGYYDRRRHLLYCGDAVQGRGSVVQHLALYYDPDAYERSLRRVGSMDIKHLVPSHPYLPLQSSIVSGAQVQEFVKLSLNVYLDLDDQIRDVIRESNHPVTIDDVTTPLCARNGFATITSMATTTVRAHLERMKRRRTASMKNVDGKLFWELR
jgi:glyoxylase-like metal-dependent hydrolase (beta-lactamase superfamily II)